MMVLCCTGRGMYARLTDGLTGRLLTHRATAGADATRRSLEEAV